MSPFATLTDALIDQHSTPAWADSHIFYRGYELTLDTKNGGTITKGFDNELEQVARQPLGLEKGYFSLGDVAQEGITHVLVWCWYSFYSLSRTKCRFFSQLNTK
jgi:hypothetical protein